MGSPEHKQKIWNYIKDIKVGMLTTHGEDELHSRPMQLVQNEYDNKLWFFTDANDPKVKEIQEDKTVNIAFSDRENGVYVSMAGNAKLTHDKELIDKFWNDYVSAWYSKGKEDDSVALLEIKVNHGEHWDINKDSRDFFYEVEKAKNTSKTPDVGEHQKF
ncbi:MAG: pyridoxamine 5'-phosphate oxidase [Halobacteriovoraceae bacterium]|nr:pyridoxamine 5'-phosphate oxidase [Halobacteriovoraceae bacterium]|tara:strand:+ start:6125 stop:6604 length:480 start_codon:yes stop_codon:yes gene_type:complete